MFRLITLILLGYFIHCFGQGSFSDSEILQGYKVNGKDTYFVFDETLYSVKPYRVIIEGSFRNWDHNLIDKKWQLQKQNEHNGLWVLKSPELIEPGSSFKFRIDEGKWITPLKNLPNIDGGNLIFEMDKESMSMTAEMVNLHHIRVLFSKSLRNYNLDPANYRLFKADGVEVPILNVFYIRPGEIQVYPALDLLIDRVYYLQEKSHHLRSLVSYDGWFRHVYSDKKLGAYYESQLKKTIFRIFAPRANQVKLYLYKSPESKNYTQHTMKMDGNYIWEISLDGNLEGQYYDYTIHGPNDPGNHFFESVPVHVSDPYGQVSVDSFGPCRIWPKVIPPRPVAGGRPAMKDVIAYEVHIQDFTRKLPIDENKRGTFAGFVEKGLINSAGRSIGFDHLIDLGINVVHLQPIQEFLHYPADEWRKTFINDPYMKDNGINEENYQWGYRITHFMAIESRYRTKGSDWGAQNIQFRDMVEALHDAGIAVVVDMVFNHTGERMDGRMDYFNFSVIDMPYYYRTNNKLEYIGEYGTEVKSEERPMVQRWIYDQCKNLIEQYGVDGFRIDLAGLTDKQTLINLRREVGDDIIIYGEPWIDSADKNYEKNPDWNWYKEDAPITFFQDDARNAFKGSPFALKDKFKDRGYAGGNGERESIKKALSAGFKDDVNPLSGINYLDIHDNWALADRYAINDWDGRKGVEENRIKIAATLLFTSLGPIVIHGGSEFLRSKGSAPLKEVKKKFQDNYLHFHGKNDTYNLATPNLFIWENKGKAIGDDGGKIKCNYQNMYEYWRGLVALRKSKTGEIFRISEKPADNYYLWFEPENKRLIGYLIADQLLVLVNTDTVSGKFDDVTLLQGNSFQLIADINQINPGKGLNNKTDSILNGGKNYSIDIPAESLKIWARK